MLDSILSTTVQTTGAALPELLFCTVASLILGMGVACIYMFRNAYNKSFVLTLALLPAMVQAVIILVNGNLGAGVAVMGAFSLVRFRSVPGSAREISSIFFAMAIGLATGMGYVVYALLFLVIIGLMTVILCITRFGDGKPTEQELKITIPENLDYTGIFDDLFDRYAKSVQLVQVKTTNMGSMFELRYHITFREPNIEKRLIDELRCRNGNLAITCGRIPVSRESL